MSDRIATIPAENGTDWMLECSGIAPYRYTEGMTRHPNRRDKSPRVAVIYTRVSTSRQAEEGDSLATQEAKARAYALVRGFEVVAVYSDAGVSGRSTTGRPGLEAALKRVCETKGVLIFPSLSRLARNVADALAISERVRACGGDLASVVESFDTSAPAGEFLFVMLAALARLESQQIGERTEAVLTHLRGEGKRYSRRIPFGFTLDGDRLVPVAAEQRIVKLMGKLATEGKGTRATATELNRRGFTRRDGRPWTWEAVRDITAARARELDAPRCRVAASVAAATPVASPAKRRGTRHPAASGEVLQ